MTDQQGQPSDVAREAVPDVRMAIARCEADDVIAAIIDRAIASHMIIQSQADELSADGFEEARLLRWLVRQSNDALGDRTRVVAKVLRVFAHKHFQAERTAAEGMAEAIAMWDEPGETEDGCFAAMDAALAAYREARR